MPLAVLCIGSAFVSHDMIKPVKSSFSAHIVHALLHNSNSDLSFVIIILQILG